MADVVGHDWGGWIAWAPFVGTCIARVSKGRTLRELVLGVLDDLLATDAVFVGLGSGARDYEQGLRAVQERHPDRCAVQIGFDDELAHWITAGADIFLMPSRYEPCGLNQMYAQRYGTIPVVRRTGGLADSFEAFDADSERLTVFLFDEPSVGALADALGRAVTAWGALEARAALRRNAMTRGFGWADRAPEYRSLYEEAQRRAAERS